MNAHDYDPLIPAMDEERRLSEQLKNRENLQTKISLDLPRSVEFQ